MGKYEELERLQKLKESGILTEEEFNSEKIKILNGENGENSNEESLNNTYNVNKNDIEIKGDFPFAPSKIPLKLLDGEKVLFQYEATTFTGVGTTAVNGLLTLTNKRVLFNKKTSGKAFLGTGLLGVALAAGNKDVAIKFSDIVSIEAKKIRMTPGIEIITNDGFANKFTLQNSSNRDMLVELIRTTINYK